MSKVVADMHVPPAVRRWGARLGLAIVVATVIGYAPGQILRRDPRSAKLRAQLDELGAEITTLAAANAALRRDIRALRSDVGAIEERARADLGMAYPDEIVIRVEEPASAAGEVAPADGARGVAPADGARGEVAP